MLRRYQPLVLTAALLFSGMAKGENEPAIADVTLEDLLGLKTTIATKRALTSRESPGIISIVTRDEISQSGARDLKEILTLFAPGFGFGVDVEGVVINRNNFAVKNNVFKFEFF